MAGWISKAIAKAKKKISSKEVGSCEETCDLKKTSLIVVAQKKMIGAGPPESVSGVIIDAKGKTSFNKKTDSDGLAIFKPIEPGSYTITAKLSGVQEKEFLQPEAGTQAVSLGSCPVHTVSLIPLVDLKVRVVYGTTDNRGKKVRLPLKGVKIHVEGPETKDASTSNDKDGWGLFEKVKPGKYSISVTDLGRHKDAYALPGRVSTTIPEGELVREVTVDISQEAKLRIVVIDKEEKPVGGKSWELLSPIRANGTNAKNGLLEVENLNLESATGKLTLDLGPPPKPKAKAASPADPAPTPADPPPNPPPIVSTDFKDKKIEPPKVTDEDRILEWDLKINLLADMDNLKGLKGRLQNLGYGCRADSEAKTMSLAVKSYQTSHQKEKDPSGLINDIKADLMKWHDNL